MAQGFWSEMTEGRRRHRLQWRRPQEEAIPAGAQVYYVSTTGNDANNGTTKALAVQTIGAAQTLWRATRATWSAANGCYVIVLPGRHQWTSALALTTSDSGGANAPLVIRGVLGSRNARSTKVTGGRLLSDFTRSTVSGRADLAKFTVTGLISAGSVVAAQGEALNEARWPKTGFATVSGTNPVTLTGAGTVPTVAGGKTFKFGSFATADWLFTITTATQSGGSFTLGAASRNTCRACIYNAYEFLDLATEYTREGDDIFVKTSVADDPTAEVGVTTNLVTGGGGVAHIRIERISFSGSTGTCLNLDNVNDIVMTDVEVKNTGGWAGLISGTNSGFQDSALRNLGGGGVVVYGGTRSTLTSGGNFMRSNWIDNFSILERSYTPGIRFDGGVGGVIDGNFIRGSDHVGMMWSGNDHLITYNEVGEVCRTSGDMGAIYSGRDWTFRGNVLTYNIVYNVLGPGAGGARAFYLDDMYSSALVQNNIVVNTSRAVFVGGGRDNIISDNVFFSCDPAFYLDARGKGEPAGWTDSTDMDAKLAAMPYTTAPWSTAYPALATIVSNDRMAPLGNVMADNVMVDSDGGIEYSGALAATYVPDTTGQEITVSTWSGRAQQSWFDLVRPQVADIDDYFPWTTFLAKRARAAAANRPTLTVGTPSGTNLLTTQDMSDAFWAEANMLATTSTQVREVAANDVHTIAATISRSAGVATYEFIVDAEDVGARTLALVVYDGTFSQRAEGWYDITTGTIPRSAEVANGFTSPVAAITEVSVGRYRCSLAFDTDASSTGIWVVLESWQDSSTPSFLGDVSKGFDIYMTFLRLNT